MQELKSEDLVRQVDPDSLGIESTASCRPFEGILGQDRAVNALRFGLRIKGTGFNIYVSGPHGIGKMTSVKAFLEEVASSRDTPPDWCYVYSFENPYEPRAIRLPAGRGKELRDDMENLVERIKEDLPKAFDSDEYSARREEVLEEIQKRRQEISKEINSRAEEAGFSIQASPMGVMLLPAKDGQPMSREDYEKLSDREKQELDERREQVQQQIKEGTKEIRQLQRQARDKVRTLDHEVVNNTLGGLIDDLKEKYGEFDEAMDYLESVQEDIMDNVDSIKSLTQSSRQDGQAGGQMAGGTGQQGGAMSGLQQRQKMQQEAMQEQLFRKYQVNVVVDNSGQEGAPVILELNPTYNNLIGRIEKEMRMGAVSTDFTLIKAGALPRANGGFLVLQVEDVLRHFYCWEALKRALRASEVRIEELSEELGIMSIKSLRPEPIPLDVRVILIGQPLIYYLLHSLDHEFPELFKVKADFDTEMSVDGDGRSDSRRNFIGFLCTFCEKEELKHLDAGAVARVMEQSSRTAEHKGKLSTRFGDLADLIRESHYWAGESGNELITADDVQNALDQKVYRSNLMEEKVRERIGEQTILIDTRGRAVGQVNGLSIVNLGNYLFGRPMRITAAVSAGREGILDIEREAKLSGPIHSKGVMILSGYLLERYSQGRPLTLAARLVFEQSYSGVEGDSASSAELYAVLSALSGLPLRQSVAVTGSVNQHGRVQAVGGINQKIEGFFEICRAAGLTGDQGVIIPEANVRHLMLKSEVREAVEEGEFHLWSVETIDEGIELLTGETAGAAARDGSFPEGSVNERVRRRLQAFGESLKELGATADPGNTRKRGDDE